MALLVGVVVSVCVGLGVLQYVQVQREDAALNALYFSNTQRWDADVVLLQLQDSLLAPLPILLPSPPLNTSKETTRELEYLHTLVTERTAVKQAEIEAEVFVGKTIYNGISYVERVGVFTRPETYRLFTQTHTEFVGHIVRQKDLFNRVRPSLLDPALSVAIEIPGHPAYPSGHASESYFFALLFSELDPDNRESYFKDAQRIAHNREIAGLHYPSDSAAGVLLATTYMEQLNNNQWYQQQLEKAKEEWE